MPTSYFFYTYPLCSRSHLESYLILNGVNKKKTATLTDTHHTHTHTHKWYVYSFKKIVCCQISCALIYRLETRSWHSEVSLEWSTGVYNFNGTLNLPSANETLNL